MKRILSAVLAFAVLAAVLSGCVGERKTKKKAVTTIPTVTETRATRANETIPSSAASSTSPTKPTSPTVQPTTTVRRVTHTVNPTTASATRSVRRNIPPDDITSRNVNPNLGTIQQNMLNEINSLAVREIRLSEDSLTLVKGESAELKVSFDPENAAIKTLKADASGSAVSVKTASKTVTVTAKSEGESTVTVTSHNGKTAICRVKVVSAVVTDDTVLPHKELCTPENVSRWLDEIIGRGTMLGMTLNSSLSGSSFVIKTSSDTSDASFNDYCDKLVTAAVEQFAIYTGNRFEEYEFNAVSEEENGEYNFIITVNKIEETVPQ